MPWAPPSELTVTTDAAGKVTGELVVPVNPRLALSVTGIITPAAGGIPEGVDLRAEGGRSVNEIRGYFMPNGTVVGLTLAIQGDPGGKPNGSSGPFVLIPNP